eukprot:TRINITY_DN32330_c0_g1_i3.p2 TRINITY_DN32330_c0_g1~~TRINITY_DN32330_c0_g1_i3.p2  ORF type:complete len:123 (+),score=11.75 TRINITY_DN32330_c0_g1_i3:195-563(+)
MQKQNQSEEQYKDKKIEVKGFPLKTKRDGENTNIFGKPWWEKFQVDNQQELSQKQIQKSDQDNCDFNPKKVDQIQYGSSFCRDETIERIQEKTRDNLRAAQDHWKQRRKWFLKLQQRRRDLL